MHVWSKVNFIYFPSFFILTHKAGIVYADKISNKTVQNVYLKCFFEVYKNVIPNQIKHCFFSISPHSSGENKELLNYFVVDVVVFVFVSFVRYFHCIGI